MTGGQNIPREIIEKNGVVNFPATGSIGKFILVALLIQKLSMFGTLVLKIEVGSVRKCCSRNHYYRIIYF